MGTVRTASLPRRDSSGAEAGPFALRLPEGEPPALRGTSRVPRGLTPRAPSRESARSAGRRGPAVTWASCGQWRASTAGGGLGALPRRAGLPRDPEGQETPPQGDREAAEGSVRPPRGAGGPVRTAPPGACPFPGLGVLDA